MTKNENLAVETATAVNEVKNLIVEREKFKAKDGKDYWSYVVYGKVRGRNVKVDFAAKDQGGYEVLDIIFDVKPTAELIMHDEEMTDDNGKTTKYTVYEVQNVDENGIVYNYKVKPSRDSDKSLLNMLINELGGGKVV